MRGVSGSGKSTKAKEVAGSQGMILSSDEFFEQGGMYKFDPSKLGQAHKWNQDRAATAMSKGYPLIVVDNTNTQAWEIYSYLKLGKTFGYNISYIEPDWSPDLKDEEGKWNMDFLKGRNTHGVPDHAIKRMIDRYLYKNNNETDDAFTKRVSDLVEN